jgi:hypothetical protein
VTLQARNPGRKQSMCPVTPTYRALTQLSGVVYLAVFLRERTYQWASSFSPSSVMKTIEFGPRVRLRPAGRISRIHGGFTCPIGNTGNRGATHVIFALLLLVARQH